ncbi:MAG: hypothetical protein IK070_03555 [Clostridia bacterium]|nr:hypothetical protein [Clostridia bacterium]
MKNNELLESKKQELKEHFYKLDKLGYVCGMKDVILSAIENADDMRVSPLYTKLFVGDEIELFVSGGSYALSMNVQDKDNFRKQHCLSYVHNLPTSNGRGEVFSVEKYYTEYEPEFKDDLKFPQMSLMMSDRFTHMRVFRLDSPLGERTEERKEFGDNGVQGFKEQFVNDKNFVAIKNEMANILDKVVERIHE